MLHSIASPGFSNLYDTLSGTVLASPEGGAQVASPDGEFVFLTRGTVSPYELVVWDSISLDSKVIETTYDVSHPILVAPDHQPAVFVGGRGSPNYTLKRAALDASFSVTTLGTGSNVGTRSVYAADGALAFDQDYQLRVALPDGSEPVTLSSRLDHQAGIRWLGNSTVITALRGPWSNYVHVYALVVPK
jgi:hypothetical protein